jgi:heptosyltransferase-2
MTLSVNSRTTSDGGWTRDLRTLNVRKILIIKWSGIGDVAIASATIQDIYEAFPQSTLHLNTMAPCDQLFTDDPRFDEVFRLDLRGKKWGIGQHWRWLRYVRSQRYDLVVDLQCTDHSRLLLSLLPLVGGRIPHRLSYYRIFPYNIAPSAGADLHHTREYAVSALAAGGLSARCERPVLYPGEGRRRNVRELMQRHGLREHEYAVFLPGSTITGSIKRWGADHFRVLAERVHASGVANIVLLGGPDDIEECLRIQRRCGPWLVNLCGETEILDLIPLCEGARFIVGNDTGTAHVAAASGTLMMVICGPTDPRRVRPLGRDIATLQSDIPCINCYKKHCAHHSCMRLISPEDVLAHVQGLISKPPGSRGLDLQILPPTGWVIPTV